MVSKLFEKEIKQLKRLHQNKVINEGQYFLVEGYHLVEEAVKNGNVIDIYSSNEEYFGNIKTKYIDQKSINRISQTKTPQGIIALCKKLPNIQPTMMKKLIILDNIQDPGNVGTIIRTAISFGWEQIILTEGTASIYNFKTLMASQGAIFKANIIKMSKKEVLEIVHQWEFLTTVLHNSAIKLHNFRKQTAKEIAICFGNEGSGVSDEFVKQSSPIIIEMEHMNSLNVAITAGICLYNLK